MPGEEITAVEDFRASSGYVTVDFPDMEFVAGDWVWILIHFPDNQPLVAPGEQGGPGIGWRETRRLDQERSFFSVEGSMNEFSPAFDIEVLTSASSSKAGASTLGPDGTLSSPVSEISVRNGSGRVAFELPPTWPGTAYVEIFDVSGRRVRVLGESGRIKTWDGRDGSGRDTASGLYLYRVRASALSASGKFVLVR
jgi:hypothetical protein